MRVFVSVLWFLSILAGPIIHHSYVVALPEYEKGISFMMCMAYFISGVGLLFYWGTHSKIKERR